MDIPIEIKEPYALIEPQDEYYENAFGLFLKREDTPQWKGRVIDFMNCKSLDGLLKGDEVLYNKQKCEKITIDGKNYHLVADQYIYFKVVE